MGKQITKINRDACATIRDAVNGLLGNANFGRSLGLSFNAGSIQFDQSGASADLTVSIKLAPTDAASSLPVTTLTKLWKSGATAAGLDPTWLGQTVRTEKFGDVRVMGLEKDPDDDQIMVVVESFDPTPNEMTCTPNWLRQAMLQNPPARARAARGGRSAPAEAPARKSRAERRAERKAAAEVPEKPARTRAARAQEPAADPTKTWNKLRATARRKGWDESGVAWKVRFVNGELGETDRNRDKVEAALEREAAQRTKRAA
jgi:hypothetical protein